jgi:hypothetical protein
MKQHVTIIGAIRIGFSVIFFVLGAFLFILLFGIGWAVSVEDQIAFNVLTIVGALVGGMLFLLSLPGFIGGIGLLQYKPWARIVVLIVSALDLFNVPIGTIFGAYSIWALTQEETVALFEA